MTRMAGRMLCGRTEASVWWAACPVLRRALDSGGLTTLKRLVSPVYFSTDEHGVLHQGLQHVPVNYAAGGAGTMDGEHEAPQPLLFVGNHQLFAPDMPLMLAQFLKEKRMLLRGLAHPFALMQVGARRRVPCMHACNERRERDQCVHGAHVTVALQPLVRTRGVL